MGFALYFSVLKRVGIEVWSPRWISPKLGLYWASEIYSIFPVGFCED